MRIGGSGRLSAANYQQAPENVALIHRAGAAYVVATRVDLPRLAPATLEPSGAIANAGVKIPAQLLAQDGLRANAPPDELVVKDGQISHADVPGFITLGRPTLSSNNPLGVKGLGEAGTTGALAAVSNAIADALGTLGAQLPSLPCTAEKLWRAMREGRVV